MGAPLIIPTDSIVQGNLSANGIYSNGATINDGMISPTAAIAASKVVHSKSKTDELFGPAVTIAALTKWEHIVNGTANDVIVNFWAAVAVVPGGDHTVNVDLQRSTGGGAFATVLSSTILFNSSSTALVPVQGSLSATTLAKNDILRVVVTVAGSTSTQGTGLTVCLVVTESAN